MDFSRRSDDPVDIDVLPPFYGIYQTMIYFNTDAMQSVHIS